MHWRFERDELTDRVVSVQLDSLDFREQCFFGELVKVLNSDHKFSLIFSDDDDKQGRRLRYREERYAEGGSHDGE